MAVIPKFLLHIMAQPVQPLPTSLKSIFFHVFLDLGVILVYPVGCVAAGIVQLV
jgi:hypothetical protein